MDFELVPTEYTDGSINGTLYASRVRVVARSPKGFLFVGYGLNYASRDKNATFNHKIAPDAKRATLEQENVKERIERFMGAGSHGAVLKTIGKRGWGTVLLDGGGEKLRLPAVEASKLYRAAYAEVSPTTEIRLDGQKTCIQCGKHLRPHCASHRLSSDPTLDPNHPRTIEDCQRLTNHPVVGLLGYGSNQPREWWPFVSSFLTWDGESYEQEHFCSDRCATKYGRRAAQELPHLEVGHEPTKHSWAQQESVNHYDVEAQSKRQREAIEKSFGQKIDPNFRV